MRSGPRATRSARSVSTLHAAPRTRHRRRMLRQDAHRLRSFARVLECAGLLLTVAACASSSPSDAPRAQRAPLEGPTPAIAQPSTPVAAPGKLPADLTGPSQVACGAAQCTTPTQVCCVGTKEVCIERQPVATADRFGEWGATFDSCRRAADMGQVDVFACDGSEDCEAGGVCCESGFGSGSSSIRTCQPAGTICPVAELCVGGSACRSPGTACVDGTCKRASGVTACGTATCKLPGEVCCSDGDAYACKSPATCTWKLECTQPADCPKGQTCSLRGLGESWCIADPDTSTSIVACDTDADCPELGTCARMACIVGGPRKICECVGR
jgi:hypothetical protein